MFEENVLYEVTASGGSWVLCERKMRVETQMGLGELRKVRGDEVWGNFLCFVS